MYTNHMHPCACHMHDASMYMCSHMHCNVSAKRHEMDCSISLTDDVQKKCPSEEVSILSTPSPSICKYSSAPQNKSS